MINNADDIVAALRNVLADYDELMDKYVGLHEAFGKHDDHLCRLRGIVADYEQRCSLDAPSCHPVEQAAPAILPSPAAPAGAATFQDVEPVTIEEMGREKARLGRAHFLQWYNGCDDENRRRLQGIAGELKSLFPNAAASDST